MTILPYNRQHTIPNLLPERNNSVRKLLGEGLTKVKNLIARQTTSLYKNTKSCFDLYANSVKILKFVVTYPDL